MDDPRTHPTRPPAPALLLLRLIGASMGVAVTMLAMLAWSANQLDAGVRAPMDPTLMFTLVVALALGAVIAAIAMWRARVEPLIAGGRGSDDPVARVGSIQNNVIIVWAIIEGPALFAVIVHYLYHAPLAGAVGVVLIWGALAATWPKREWFEGDSSDGTSHCR